MAIRKDANTLTGSERAELVAAFLELKREGTYDQFTLRHATANMGSIHSCPAFLPWHRRFLFDLELELQRVSGNPDLGIPYWNWPEGAADASLWDDDLLGGDGDVRSIVTTGPFSGPDWRVIDRNGNVVGALLRGFGRSRGGETLPTLNEVQDMLMAVPYDSFPWNRQSNPSFRNLLEGWIDAPGFHNRGHVWVGGSMLPMTSPNDPIFYFHHCMVDKLWHEWQLRHPGHTYLPLTGGPFGQNLNDQMASTPLSLVGSRPVDVLDSAVLGIEYDSLLPGTPDAGGGIIDEELVHLLVDASETDASISTPGEVDEYQFEIGQFGGYVIETTGASDTYLTLNGPSDPTDQLAENDDGGQNFNSRIALNLSAGTYYASIRLYSAVEIGNYRISVNRSGGAQPEVTELPVDGSQFNAVISAANESDVYRFTATRRASYTIETDGATDTYLSLFGPNDQSIAIVEDDDSGLGRNSRIQWVLEPGEYYARVRHYSPNGTGAYSISVR